MKTLQVVAVSCLVFLNISLLTPRLVSAASAAHCQKSSATFLGLPTWYKYLLKDNQPSFVDPDGSGPLPGECELHYPVNEQGEEDIALAIGPIVLAVTEILLRVGTYLAIAIIVWAGFQYQLSQGEPERTKASRTMIINALIGLVVAMSATVIVNIVGTNLS